jgi:hypothetical protein
VPRIMPRNEAPIHTQVSDKMRILTESCALLDISSYAALCRTTCGETVLVARLGQALVARWTARFNR